MSLVERFYLILNFLKDIKVGKDGCSRFGCDNCSKTFSNIGDLKKHEKSVHYGEKRECEVCGVKFSRHDNLQEHMKLFHSEDYHEYECDRCMSSFTKYLISQLFGCVLHFESVTGSHEDRPTQVQL